MSPSTTSTATASTPTASVTRTAHDALQAKQSVLVNGYEVPVVDNQDEYARLINGLLEDEGGRCRRQAPLINIGYAARVLAVSHLISSFVKFHSLKSKSNVKIQLVVLGCGLDVIGLWGHSLNPDQVCVTEIDVAEICDIKRELLLKKRLLAMASKEEGGSAGMQPSFSGVILDRDGQPTSTIPNYCLVSVDLQNTDLVRIVLDEVLDKAAPTLILSELVVSYISNDKLVPLLELCNQICESSNGVFAALEPLGSFDDTSSPSTSMIGVVDGYRNQYCRKFKQKVDRGRSRSTVSSQSNSTSSSPPSQTFSPLGPTCAAINARLRKAGFRYMHTQHLSAAARQHVLNTPEVFDEHAALALHLRSYYVACAFSSKSERFLRQVMCPAARQYARDATPVMDPDGSITTIEIEDEHYIRSTFQEVYKTLSSEFVPVKKMVKTALKKDLVLSAAGNDESVIAEQYRQGHGCFLVALRYSETGERQQLGFVGVREYGTAKTTTSNATTKTAEIVRLIVDPDHRRQGIGRKLLQAAEEFARMRGYTKMVATTIDKLEGANNLYLSMEYNNDEDSSIGELTLKTYSKQL